MISPVTFAKRYQLLDRRQTAPYALEFEPDIILTQPHASGVDETCTPFGDLWLTCMTQFRYSFFTP
jgi:hypothetical protein